MEISHEGLEADDAAEPWGPCDFVRQEDGRHVFGMDRQMMEKVCRDFLDMGRFATACGFDGVLLHGGHGFLLQQFVSPLFNKRTDEFGGSVENRSRFPKMCLRALRAGMGEDKVLELRMSAEDGEEGGMTLEDSCGFAEQIDGIVDIFHVSNGIKKYGNGGDTFSDIFDVHGVNLERAAAIKSHLKKSLVAVVGGSTASLRQRTPSPRGSATSSSMPASASPTRTSSRRPSRAARTYVTVACAASTATLASASTPPTSPCGISCHPRSS